MITFDEKSHTYKCAKTGRELISATTLIGKYKKPFDKMENATRVANREGLDVEFVLEMWEKEKNRACDYGTNIHKVMEDYLTEGTKNEEHESLYTSFDKWKHIFKKFPTLLCEEKLHDLDNFIAGTADLIYENKTHFMVGDFKTNKAFNFFSQYNDFMLKPVEHLSVCEFNTYALQLSLYGYLHEKSSGKKCTGCVIFYKDKQDKFYPIRVNYMKEEIIALIADYNNPNSLSSKIA
jgi:ATP-dependent exoDNAse (exonuclease V) beta subunit